MRRTVDRSKRLILRMARTSAPDGERIPHEHDAETTHRWVQLANGAAVALGNVPLSQPPSTYA